MELEGAGMRRRSDTTGFVKQQLFVFIIIQFPHFSELNQFEPIVHFFGPLFGVSPAPRLETVLQGLQPCSEK